MGTMSLSSVGRTGLLRLWVIALAVVVAACGGSGGGLDLEELGVEESTTTEAVVADTAQTTVPEPADDAESGTTPSDDTSDQADPVEEPTTTTEPEQAPLPELCDRELASPLVPSSLTFTVDSGLFSVGFDGEFECLLIVPDGVEVVTWGAQADKVLFSDGAISTVEGSGKLADDLVRISPEFSRPTGFNVVWVDGGMIVKSASNGDRRRSLDIGVPVSEVVYHPDGNHLLAVTSDPTFGGSSVYVTDNEGQNASVLAFADDAVISDLTVTPDGTMVLFVATHADGIRHVHRLDLAAATEEVINEAGSVELWLQPSAEAQVETLYESGQALTHLVVNSDGTRAALAVGTCETGSSIEWLDLLSEGYGISVLPAMSLRPVGFVTESSLAVMAYDDSCSNGGDLYLVDLDTGEPTPIRAGVDSAAIRRIDPSTLYSLVDVFITGFA